MEDFDYERVEIHCLMNFMWLEDALEKRNLRLAKSCLDSLRLMIPPQDGNFVKRFNDDVAEFNQLIKEQNHE